MLLKRGIQYPTVKCYSEGEFSTKRFDKFKECQTNESTKKDSFTKKKKESIEQKETNSNVSHGN